MSGSVAGYTADEVCRIIDLSWSEWRLKYAAAPGVERMSLPDAQAVISGLDLPNVNSVFAAALDPAWLETRIEELAAPFRERSVGFTWWVGPCSEPPDLGQALPAAGFEKGALLVGMAADLDRLALDQGGDGPELVRIGDRETLKAYCRATALAYGTRPPGADLALAALSRQDYGPGGDLAHFAVRRAGELAATASVMMRGDWALLAGVGTIPEARGSGLATAVTVRALEEARARGCRLAVLQASAGGRPIYEKLGFREYCRLRRFLWSPDRG